MLKKFNLNFLQCIPRRAPNFYYGQIETKAEITFKTRVHKMIRSNNKIIIIYLFLWLCDNKINKQLIELQSQW